MHIINVKYRKIMRISGENGNVSLIYETSDSMDDINEIEIHDGSSNLLTTTTILEYCKSKILNPYLKFLTVVGLRPICFETRENSVLKKVLSILYIAIIALLLLLGYLLQYMSCFRRDRGICSYNFPKEKNFYLHQIIEDEKAEVYQRICHGSLVFSFVVPAVLHIGGYLYSVIFFHMNEDDQLPGLMERVFLSSSNISNSFQTHRSLVKKLWLFVILNLIWILFSMIPVCFIMIQGDVSFKWLLNRSTSIITTVKVLLVVIVFFHDLLQASIIANYCLQAQLLMSYIHFLRDKLLQHRVRSTDWMRETEEFKKMLRYFNQDVSPAVCMFTIMNICYAISGILWLFNYDKVDKETVPVAGISVMNVMLWVIITSSPFIQAARLSMACEILKNCGQEVRVRPFAHQDTPLHELDSILLYTSSLKINAKLFYVPVTGTYVCLGATILGICILILGQLHYLSNEKR